MASVVEICNGALNQLGATTISFTYRRFKKCKTLQCKDLLKIRDAVFRSHPWNCLQKRQELSAADTTAPAWGFYSLQYDFTSRLFKIT